MEEPPAKRAKRTDSSAMWDEKNSTRDRSTASPAPRSPRPSERDRKFRGVDDDSRNGTPGSFLRENDRRRRPRSPRGEKDRYERHRSRSPRGGSGGGKDRDGDRGYRFRDRDRGSRDHARYERDQDNESRHRSRSRDRNRGKDNRRMSRERKAGDRKRSRSRSPFRNGPSGERARSRSPVHAARSRNQPPERKGPKANMPNGTSRSVKNESADAGMDLDEDDMETLMRKTMGFSNFKTTQNTKVPGNQIYGVRKEKKTEYRQYMNRVGGFNRPLSPGR